MSWPEIESVSIKDGTIKFRRSEHLGLPAKDADIEYNELLFDAERNEVIALIRQYRPDLITDVQIQAVADAEASIRQTPRA
jgi:hypothetical protein